MNHEAAPMLAWPRIPRASPFAARIARAPFPRAIPNTFRSRLQIKPGPRSLQWKRDASATPTAQVGDRVDYLQNGAANVGNNVSSPTGRNLTYVRTEMK